MRMLIPKHDVVPHEGRTGGCGARHRRRTLLELSRLAPSAGRGLR
jgi:hypothetical protein